MHVSKSYLSLRDKPVSGDDSGNATPNIIGKTLTSSNQKVLQNLKIKIPEDPPKDNMSDSFK